MDRYRNPPSSQLLYRDPFGAAKSALPLPREGQHVHAASRSSELPRTGRWISGSFITALYTLTAFAGIVIDHEGLDVRPTAANGCAVGFANQSRFKEYSREFEVRHPRGSGARTATLTRKLVHS